VAQEIATPMLRGSAFGADLESDLGCQIALQANRHDVVSDLSERLAELDLAPIDRVALFGE
jgi:hypothetical protein